MAIKSNLALVQRRAENLEPRYQTSLATAQNAVDQMTRLTEALLLLATAGNKAEVPGVGSIDVGALLNELVSDHQIQAEAKEIKITCHIAGGAAMVRGLREQLNSIFGNILSNAINYTPEHGEVEVSLASVGSDAVVRISDTGMGISAADLPRIFDRFWRADRARHHASSGAGLGLSIAHTFVQQLGGKINVQSKTGSGSTFIVTLPLLGGALKDDA
jgi:signal transduction histidine kinase